MILRLGTTVIILVVLLSYKINLHSSLIAWIPCRFLHALVVITYDGCLFPINSLDLNNFAISIFVTLLRWLKLEQGLGDDNSSTAFAALGHHVADHIDCSYGFNNWRRL